MERQLFDIKQAWKSFKSGDKEAFAFLYNQHVDILFRYGTKLTANEELVKDSIQEIFLDLYLKREKNKTNPENLKYYLILALKRSLIKKLKRNRKLVNEEIEDTINFEPEYSIERTIIEREENAELSGKVKNALKQLPAKQKEALYLRFNESMEYKDIATLLNISTESVRKQVYRAIKSIRESFRKDAFLFWLLLSRK